MVAESLRRDLHHLEKQHNELSCHMAAAEQQLKAARERTWRAEERSSKARRSCQELRGDVEGLRRNRGEGLSQPSRSVDSLSPPGKKRAGPLQTSEALLTTLQERCRRESELRQQTDRLHTLQSELVIVREAFRDREAAAKRDVAELDRTNELISMENRRMAMKLKDMQGDFVDSFGDTTQQRPVVPGSPLPDQQPAEEPDIS